MTDEDALHRIITKVMLNNCCCTINENDISLRKLTGDCPNVIANCFLGEAEAFISGSMAELYIQPALRCYGDIDIMHTVKTTLVIQYGKSPPIELWDCHQDTVTVCEIVDNHKPGYVYLQQSYIVRKKRKRSIRRSELKK